MARVERMLWIAAGAISIFVVVTLIVLFPSAILQGPLTVHKGVTFIAAISTVVSAIRAMSADESPDMTDSKDAIRAILSDTSERDPMSTQEIADALGKDRISLFQELRPLKETSEIESRRTSDNEFLWWRPTDRRDKIISEYSNRVEELVFWTEDGDVRPRGDWKDLGYEEAVLLYLVGKYYANNEGVAEEPCATWGELVEMVDIDGRIKRSVAEALDSDSVLKFVKEDYEGNTRNFQILVEWLPNILDRIEESKKVETDKEA